MDVVGRASELRVPLEHGGYLADKRDGFRGWDKAAMFSREERVSERLYKPGRRGVAVAPHALASQSALGVLRDGGNAIEAMVAAAATIAKS